MQNLGNAAVVLMRLAGQPSTAVAELCGPEQRIDADPRRGHEFGFEQQPELAEPVGSDVLVDTHDAPPS